MRHLRGHLTAICGLPFNVPRRAVKTAVYPVGYHSAMSDDDATQSVLFVCLGNICRSPTAEGVMRQRIVEADLDDRILADSAGTGAYHEGERADPRMRQVAERRGYELTSRARQMTRDDFDRFDLVLAMDQENLWDLEALAGGPQPHVQLFSKFSSGDGPRDIPDPYYGGAQGFETVLDLIEDACPRILDHLLER